MFGILVCIDKEQKLIKFEKNIAFRFKFSHCENLEFNMACNP